MMRQRAEQSAAINMARLQRSASDAGSESKEAQVKYPAAIAGSKCSPDMAKRNRRQSP